MPHPIRKSLLILLRTLMEVTAGSDLALGLSTSRWSRRRSMTESQALYHGVVSGIRSIAFIA
jgi:hypothetical protein